MLVFFSDYICSVFVIKDFVFDEPDHAYESSCKDEKEVLDPNVFSVVEGLA